MGAEGKYDLKLAAGYDTSSSLETVAPGTSVGSGKSATSSAGKIFSTGLGNHFKLHMIKIY
jgi:hypothetical protein